MLAPFQNEPLTGFSDPNRAAAYRLALAEVRRRLGSHKPLIIGGEMVDTGERIISLNPAKPVEVVGTVAVAGAAQIDAALEAAWGAFPDWAGRPAAERAATTVKLASELRHRKLELAAWETLEEPLYQPRDHRRASRGGVQPFGGFKMSGTNAKAGGPDYVRLFLEMKTVVEKI